MPSLGAFKTTNDRAQAFATARRIKAPLLITYEIPASRIENTVINLTVEDKVVYLALDPEDEDLEQQLARFQLRSFRGSLVDVHGNVLKKGLLTSIDMVEAVESLSELVRESAARFKQSLEKGRDLVGEGQFEKALEALKIFAFAAGSPDAEAGKVLFDEVAQVAQEAYQALLVEAPEFTSADSRDTWVKTLRAFSRAWKGSPAGQAARLEAKEWKALQLD